MYKCSVCRKAVIVEGVTTPIRACDCKKADGTPSAIIMDMQATAKGRSQFKQK